MFSHVLKHIFDSGERRYKIEVPAEKKNQMFYIKLLENNAPYQALKEDLYKYNKEKARLNCFFLKPCSNPSPPPNSKDR